MEAGSRSLATRASLGDHLAALGSLTRSEHEVSGRLFVRCSIEVRCEHTTFGDTVVITGSADQFGSWRPERGLRLMTDESSFPIWRCEPLLRGGAVDEIEYKFVIVRADGSIDWEPLGSNRKLILPTDVDSLNLVAEWGSATTWSMGPSAPPGAMTPPGSHGYGCSSPSYARPPAAPHLSSAGNTGSGAVHGGAVHGGAVHGAHATGGGGEVDPSLNERLLVVMNELPLNISRDAAGGWEVAWDESSLLATSVQGGRHLLGGLNLEVIFIGRPKCHVPPEAEAEVAAMVARFNCLPVWLPQGSSGCHDFASTVLWPILHNQLPDRHAGGRGGDGSVVPAMWKAYIAGNEAYAAAVRQTLRSGDLVWVHNYHLLLLPAKLREAPSPSCIISLFLHTPFPSPELWRVLPFRNSLLEGARRPACVPLS